MQNLRGIFLSKEERERQGIGKKGGDVSTCFLQLLLLIIKGPG